jgi:hypothetical protein
MTKTRPGRVFCFGLSANILILALVSAINLRRVPSTAWIARGWRSRPVPGALCRKPVFSRSPVRSSARRVQPGLGHAAVPRS